MLVDSDKCAIDEDVFEIGVIAESFENALPNALLHPAPEARIYCEPLAERFWQIAPRRTCASNPQNGFDEETVVTPTAARITDFARQLRRDPFPLRVVQRQSNQG